MVLSEYITQLALPFLLVFVVVFAILQKSKILGDGKAQIDSFVAFVIGVLTVSLPITRNIIVGLMPWMVVGISVIFIFLVLYGFVAGDLSGANFPNWLKTTFLVLAGLFTLGVVLYVSGLGKFLGTWMEGVGGTGWAMNLVSVVLIIGLVILAVSSSKHK